MKLKVAALDCSECMRWNLSVALKIIDLSHSEDHKNAMQRWITNNSSS